MKTTKILLEFFVAILVILLIYTAASKLLNFHEHTKAMRAQPLLPALQTFLIYAVPLSEILAVVLMVIPVTRKIGLWLTLGLLTVFTGYIILVQLNFYSKIPCSCGGVIRTLSWGEHLVFNVCFILISIAAIWLNRHENTRYTSGELLASNRYNH